MRTNSLFSLYLRDQWVAVVSNFFLTLAAAGLTVLQPWPTKLLLDHVVLRSPFHFEFREWLAASGLNPTREAILVIVTFGNLALFAASSLIDAGLRRAAKVRRQIMAVDRLLLGPVRTVLMSITLILLMAHLSTTLTKIALMVVAGMTGASLAVQTLSRAGSERRSKEETNARTNLQQALLGIPVLIAVSHNGHEASDRLKHSSRTQGTDEASHIRNFIFSFITIFGSGIILWAGARQALYQTVSVGSILVFTVYVNLLHAQTEELLDWSTVLQGLRLRTARAETFHQHARYVGSDTTHCVTSRSDPALSHLSRRRGRALVTGRLFQAILDVLKPWPMVFLVDYVFVGRSIPLTLRKLLEYLPGPSTPPCLISWSIAATVLLFLLSDAWERVTTYASGKRATPDGRTDSIFKSHSRDNHACSVTGHSANGIMSPNTLPQVIQPATALIATFGILWCVDARLSLLLFALLSCLVCANIWLPALNLRQFTVVLGTSGIFWLGAHHILTQPNQPGAGGIVLFLSYFMTACASIDMLMTTIRTRADAGIAFGFSQTDYHDHQSPTRTVTPKQS